MKRFLPAIPFALVFAAVVAYGQYSSYTRNLQVWATGLIANVTNFFGANRTNLLREIPEIGGALQKSGGTVTGEVAIIGNGVGQFGVGSTNNPVSPLVVMAYDGNQFEMGGGSGGFGGPLSVGFPWLTVADGVAASWSIPMSAPSFSGSFIGDGAGLSNITIPPEIARTTNVVSKAGDTMTGDLAIVTDGVGQLGVGSTNNPGIPLFVMAYDGYQFEMGGGSGGFGGPLAVGFPWLTVSDGTSASWSIPVSGITPDDNSSNTLFATTAFVKKVGGGGTGNGNADTNAANAWSQAQTFNGPVLIGDTNLAQKLSELDSGKQAYSSALASLSTNNAAAMTNLNASELRSGTVPTGVLPSALQPLVSGEAGGLTAALPATNATQLVNLAQLQSYNVGGQHFYFTQEPAAGFALSGVVRSTNWASQSAILTATTNNIATTAANDYVAFVSTNTFKSIASGSWDVEFWAYENTAGSATVTAEVYLVNSETGSEEFEFEPSPTYQTVNAGATPTKLVFSLPSSDYSSTTNLYAVIKLKFQVTGSPTVSIVSGGAYPSHFSFSVPDSNFVTKSGDTMTGPLTLASTEAPGTSNKVAASTEFVAKALLGAGTGNANTNAENAWSEKQTFNGDIDVGAISAASFSTATPIGFASGGHGAATAAGARTNLGVVPGVDVQAFRIELLQLATALATTGDMGYRNSAGVITNTTTTAAGRALLEAATAAAQWAILRDSATTNGAYNASSWDGVTDRVPNLDQFRDAFVTISNGVTSANAPLSLSNGVLSLDTSGLGGGGGGGGVTWLTNEGPAAYLGLNVTTNWPMMTVTISSNDLPNAVGKFLFGYASGVISNASGSTISVDYRVEVNGVRVIEDLYQPSSSTSRGKLYVANFMLVRESSNTASFVQLGGSAVPINPGIGYAGDAGSSAQAFSLVATNITVDWSSNVTLSLKWDCSTTVLGSPTNANAGFTKISAALLKYNEAPTNTPFAPTINSPIAGQVLVYNGSNWVNGDLLTPFDSMPEWQEIVCPLIGHNTATALEPFTSGLINGGTGADALSSQWGKGGVVTMASGSSTNSGGYVGITGANFYPTNETRVIADYRFVQTNGAISRVGFMGGASGGPNSTNLVEALVFSATNGVFYGEAVTGTTSRSITPTGFQCDTNTWYNLRMFATNQVAVFSIYTNRNQLAWSGSLTSNIPTGTVGFGFNAYGTASTALSQVVSAIDSIGVKFGNK